MADEAQEREGLERLVLRYLLQHPAAADSITGVRLWWLRETMVNQGELQSVLDHLQRKGWLVTRGDRPETRIYSMNEREHEAVKKFVDSGERRDG